MPGRVHRGLQLREDGQGDQSQRRIEGGRKRPANTMKENIINSSFPALSLRDGINLHESKIHQAKTNSDPMVQNRDARGGSSIPVVSKLTSSKNVSGRAQEDIGGIGNSSVRLEPNSKGKHDELGEPSTKPLVFACTSQVHTQIGSSLRGMNARGQIQLVECGARRLQTAQFVCSMECGIMRVKFEVRLSSHADGSAVLKKNDRSNLRNRRNYPMART